MSVLANADVALAAAQRGRAADLQQWSEVWGCRGGRGSEHQNILQTGIAFLTCHIPHLTDKVCQK